MYHVVVQRAVTGLPIPSTAQFKKWVKEGLRTKLSEAEVSIRIVDKEEMTFLNSTYRNKNKPTNVLSFPADLPEDIELSVPLLGDIVICAEVILEEAQEQQKNPEAHWAHMIVHGLLHLQGYDHENNADAEVMEAEEKTILKRLGFDDPYQIQEMK